MFFDVDRDEGCLFIGRYGHWSLMIRWPRISFYRKRRHPSQQRTG